MPLLSLALVAFVAQKGQEPTGPGGGGVGKLGLGRLYDAANAVPVPAQTIVNMGQRGLMATAPHGTATYPGLRFTPKTGSWDLSRYGHVDAGVSNSGPNPIVVTLRVENAGLARDRRWSSARVTLGPGEAKSLTATFGYGENGRRGYRLNPARIVGVSLLASRPPGAPKVEGQLGFIVSHLTAEGSPGERPGKPSGWSASGFGG